MVDEGKWRLDDLIDIQAQDVWAGVSDIAVLGGRLFRIHPAQPDPTENAAELHVIDRNTLRVAGGDG